MSVAANSVFRGTLLFQAHSNAQQNTASNKLSPVLRTSGSDRSKQRKDASHEDGAASTEIMIDWV